MARDSVTEPSQAEPKVSALRASVSRAAHLRSESYPILCDYEHDHVGREIAPDGHPWRKACPDCAFRTNDPQGLGFGYQDEVVNCGGDFVFYCVHREDAGLTRICACWAALRSRRATQGTAARSDETRRGSAGGNGPVGLQSDAPVSLPDPPPLRLVAEDQSQEQEEV